MGVRFSPGVLKRDTHKGAAGAGSMVGRCATLIPTRPRVQTRTAHDITFHSRISSTGQSTCLVNRRRGFETCIRLNASVAQWIRAASFYLVGWGFESLRRLDQCFSACFFRPPNGSRCMTATTMAPTTSPMRADAAVLTSQANTPPIPSTA
jgi:hypothetical protein